MCALGIMGETAPLKLYALKVLAADWLNSSGTWCNPWESVGEGHAGPTEAMIWSCVKFSFPCTDTENPNWQSR